MSNRHDTYRAAFEHGDSDAGRIGNAALEAALLQGALKGDAPERRLVVGDTILHPEVTILQAHGLLAKLEADGLVFRDKTDSVRLTKEGRARYYELAGTSPNESCGQTGGESRQIHKWEVRGVEDNGPASSGCL